MELSVVLGSCGLVLHAAPMAWSCGLVRASVVEVTRSVGARPSAKRGAHGVVMRPITTRGVFLCGPCHSPNP